MKRRGLQASVLALLVVVGLWAGQFIGSLIAVSAGPPSDDDQALTPAVLLAQNADGASISLEISTRAEPLLMFALSVDCQYCRRNLPHWRDIVRALRDRPGAPEVLVLSLSSPAETLAYLETNRLPKSVVFVDKNELEALGLPGVPGTLAVSPGDPVLRRWVGVLKPESVAKVTSWARSY